MDMSSMYGVITLGQLKNQPFASNLENAQMLAELTRARIDKIALERIPSTLAMDNKIHDLNIFKEKGYPVEFQTEYDKQKKINRYLYGTLKHLNVTIDILID